MTTCLGKNCSFDLPRVPFVNCCQIMYLVISLLVWGQDEGSDCISSWSLLIVLLCERGSYWLQLYPCFDDDENKIFCRMRFFIEENDPCPSPTLKVRLDVIRTCTFQCVPPENDCWDTLGPDIKTPVPGNLTEHIKEHDLKYWSWKSRIIWTEYMRPDFFDNYLMPWRNLAASWGN